MTPVCIRCNQPIPKGTLTEPVMTGRGKKENLTLLGMRAQHPADVEGHGCEVKPDPYAEGQPDGYLWYLYEQAERHPFPAYRKFRVVTPSDTA